MQDVVKELLLVTSFERRGASQQFEQKHSKIPDIQGLVMPTLLDHLRRQVLRRTTVRQPRQILIEKVGPAEVSKLDGVVCVQQDVLWLDVSVDDGWVHGV